MKTAYPQTQTTCTIKLYSNIPFDNSYQHHSLVSSLFKFNGGDVFTGSHTRPCESFIDRIKTGGGFYYTRWTLTGDFNFNFTNGLIASVVLELTPAQTNANYMMLKCGNDYYYYFITGINQLNGDTYNLSLELDVLMTYQDEFLRGMDNVPVFTARKHSHRFTDDGLMPACPDFKIKEPTFSNIDANNITEVLPSVIDTTTLGVPTLFREMKNVLWLYICCDGADFSSLDPDLVFMSNYNGADYPLGMLALPINVDIIKYYGSSSNLLKTITNTDVLKCINKLVGSGYFHGAKISSFPPFLQGATYVESTNTLTIVGNETQIDGNLYNYKIGNQEFIIDTATTTGQGEVLDVLILGCMFIRKSVDVQYPLVTNGLSFSGTKPSVFNARKTDPKLKFSPFTKYFITAQYSAEGYEFFPELLFSDYLTSVGTDYFKLYSTFTTFIGDNSYFTRLRPVYINSDYVYNNYQYSKVGLSGNANYTMPTGTNALDVFNATQQQSFQQSKVASGITSGLSIAGGIASIAVGAGMTATTGGLSPMGIGLVTSGATAIASGVAGEVNTITSSFAKKQDLNNTPNNIAISGGSYIGDRAIYNNSNGEYPAIVVYETNEVAKQSADDFFYKYGYQVARECFFNTEINYTATAKTSDRKLIGRSIFNYIQINEDITNKINADIPHIIKQKLSSIFNKGITLWSMFYNPVIWNGDAPNTSTDPDKWFMKDTYDNTEVNIQFGS